MEGDYVCNGCLAEDYFRCDECGEYRHNGCRDRRYTQCAECGGYFHDDTVHTVYGWNGHMIWVCDACLGKHLECRHVGSMSLLAWREEASS